MQTLNRSPVSDLPGRMFTIMMFSIGIARSSWAADPVAFFENRIRPVLVQYCYECHSSKSDPIEGGLQLDTRAGIRQGGDSGPAVAPGDIEASLLVRAIRYGADSIPMPPSGRLPEEVVDDFETWIEQGAVDPRDDEPTRNAPSGIDWQTGRQHWAFQPLVPRALPHVRDPSWCREPLDRFVLAKLEGAQLQPAHLADRRTRLRRLYFDLVGIPPTPAQVARFCRDSSPRAWIETVDRLLSSRAFAEHWGRKWLDVARYADSNGNDFNATYHQAWRYRNYVIDALAADKPFDHFVHEQLAGDLLPAASPAERAEKLIATGFLMLGPKMLSERDKQKLQFDVADEQIDTYGKTFLGLTLGCARCHDHKYDPIPTEDYYALAGVFCSMTTLEGEIQEFVSDWVELELPTDPEHQQRWHEYRGQRQELENRIRRLEDERSRLQAGLDRASLVHEGLVVDNVEAELRGDWKESRFVKRFVGGGYLHDDDRAKGEKSVVFSASLLIDGVYEVRLAYTAAGNRATNVPVEIRHRDGVQRVTLDQTRPPAVENLFQPLGIYSFPAGLSQVVTVSNASTDGYVVVDAIQLIPLNRSQLAEGTEASPIVAPQQLDDMRTQLVALRTASRELKEQLRQLEERSPPPAPRAMAARDAATPSDVRLRVRGDHNNPGPFVPRGLLRVLSNGDARLRDPRQSGRLELALWTTTSAGPLTARVFVNRVWHHLLGAGIVRSCDNFGRLGEMPSHTELLDSLANDFMRDGWSVKKLVRRIVLSQTYQMASSSDGVAAELDPENRLLWRAHRKRLSAEQLRDSLLAVCHALDTSPDTSPVAKLGRLVNNNSGNEQEFERHETMKRSVYLPIVRNELSDLFVAFDFADPDRVVGRRPETNVPVQALLLLNHPLVRGCAERIVHRLICIEAEEARLRTLYQDLFQRDPSTEELRRDIQFVRANSATAGGSAEGVIRSWIDVCHALLASTEFRYLD